MTELRRLLAVSAFFGLVAIISSSLQGQSAKKTAGSATTPQFTPARQVSQLAESADSRFSAPGVLTYQPLKGDAYFALSIQPKLEKQADRPRDIVIMMSTTATQGGTGFIASNQIAEGIIAHARENDRISLWTANEPKKTVDLTRGFLLAKDFADGKRLKDALEKYRKNEYPSGTTDLKNALSEAVKSFDTSKNRQRVFLFLGDGMSAFNPLNDVDRHELARTMVAGQIAFFPVPLGIRLDPHTLHGLANSTGGMVLRTTIEEEKLVDALKRYEQAFAGPVLYKASIQLPAEMTGMCPSELPPLRADSPTLVVGRMKNAPKQIEYTINGIPAGSTSAVAIKATERVLAHNLDNYFLVGMIDQWAKASKYPAILRADRALATTYEQTRLEHQNCLETAQMALEEYKLDAAHRMFEQARNIAPHDGQAAAGIKIVDRLKDGSLTKEDLRKRFEQRSGKADELKSVDGKARWTKGVDLALLLQEEKKGPGEAKKPGELLKAPGIAPEDLLKEHRNRLAVEEQKIANMVDDAIRMGRRNLASDPDGTLDLLRNLFLRVNDHPDLSAGTRDALTNRLQAALQTSAAEAKSIKMQKLEVTQAAAVATAALLKDQERKSFEDRVDAQFRVFKNLMNQARYEENTKMEILQAMVAIQDDARLRGHRVPVSSKAMYDIALAALPLQTHNTLVRKREQNWLSLMMGVERAHIPYPDEPYIHFPPLATWKALIQVRKDKYEVTSLPDDEEGRREASKIYRLLQQPIETKGLHEKVKLRTALEYFSDKFGGNLPILVDKEAFSADLGADAPDPYEEEVSLPPVPSKMVMNTALRLILSQVGKGEATYLIRRSFIEITTNKRYLEDKVIRIYPVGDLAMPINGGAQGGGSLTGGFGISGGIGGFPGGIGGFPGGIGGFPGGIGGGIGGIGGFPGGIGGFPGGIGGGIGGIGGFPGGIGGFPGGIGGFPGGIGGFPGGIGGFPGGIGGFPGGIGGGIGAGGGGIGGFTGSFNGSLGAVGATQATGLIDIITRIVDPGNWNRPPSTPPLMMGMVGFPGVGFMGFGGMFMGFPGGMMMGGAMMVGAGPPPDPTIVPPDPTTSNSIDFFPPALAIIVRAPSRVHTSITGGIVGGRARRLEAAASLEIEAKGALARAKDPKVKVAPGMDVAKKEKEKLDPLKVWNDAFVKGGVTPGHVVATADFLFESGHYKHAAEFLKANLRHGVVVRPWVFEALAVALESSGADPEEIRRARLSGIALDPDDAQGFLSAARAMADRGQHKRAIAFCRQAAQLEPNDFHPYEVALAYAETAKDPVAMEWAVAKLVSQDWPVDNLMIQSNAKKRLGSLVTTLKSENRATDAEKLEAALQRLNQRDLIVQLVWDNAGGPAELTMKVKEPTGNVCTMDQKQTTGGGILIGYNLTEKDPNCQYIVSEAFPGEYEITVSRVFGQPLNNRARLMITQNAGTPKQTRRIEIIKLDQNAPVKITLKEGRRTELATVSPAAEKRRDVAKDEKERSAFHDLRAVANPGFYGASGPRGNAGTPGMMPSAMAARDSKAKAPATPIMQTAINSKNGLPMTAQMRLSGDQSTVDVVIRPFFDMISSRQNRPAVSLSAIPGGQ
jgi:hypothetical protein